MENKTFMFFCCSVVILGSISVGLMLGITSPLIPDIQNDKHNSTPHLDPKEVSWFGVSACFHCVHLKVLFDVAHD